MCIRDRDKHNDLAGDTNPGTIVTFVQKPEVVSAENIFLTSATVTWTDSQYNDSDPSAHAFVVELATNPFSTNPSNIITSPKIFFTGDRKDVYKRQL